MLTNTKKYYFVFIIVFVIVLIYYACTNTTLRIFESPSFNDNFANETKQESSTKYNYLAAYTDLLDCKIHYTSARTDDTNSYKYELPASENLYSQRIVRGILIYFPIKSFNHFYIELKWLYRSWIEMQKYEPTKWRTDLILFIDDEYQIEKANEFQQLFDLNCTFNNVRKAKTDNPMCTLIAYKAITDRKIDVNKLKFPSVEREYDYWYNEVNLFNNNTNMNYFYAKLKDLSHYGYLDSILMAFDGYNHLSDSYDFLMRSDMDVFLTPLFAKWLPRYCNDFVVGGGAYSNQFNMKRLQRIAKNINLESAFEWNLGSTW